MDAPNLQPRPNSARQSSPHSNDVNFKRPRPKILTVDDRAENLVALRQILHEVDAEVIDATTGNQALAATLDHDFALAILDVQMPAMDGYELAELLRGDPRTQHLPIIFLTAAYNEEEQVFKGYQAGAVDYIVKPYHPTMLLSKVEVFLELNRKAVDLELKAEALRQSEEQLRQVAADLSDAGRRKDEFLAMLAHELRNPLAALSGALHVLDEPAARVDQMDAAREVAGRQVRQLQRLIDDLLDISRITHGKIDLRKEFLDLTDVAERAVEMARPLIEARGHQLTVSWEKNHDLTVHGDPARLEQIIVNLLTNAVKYTPQSGHITLIVEAGDDQHMVRVHDTGVGIPADVLPNIFDVFAQAPRSLDRNEGGLGLGLTLVQALVKMHDGTIHVSSVEGEGSEFVVCLPAEASSQSPKSAPPETTSPSRTAKRVLIVDDNRDSAHMLGMLLKSSGHVIETAHDGEEALHAVRRFGPDAVLLDIGLPKLNGYEVARHIRADDSLRQPLIIAVSGYGQSEDRRRSQSAGMDTHLVKPIDPGALRELLAAATC